MDIRELMEKQWNERAKKNARKFVALKDSETEEKFIASGLRHAKQIVKILPIEDIRTLKVLDLGGGIGRISMHIAPLVKELTLTDISSEMIKIASEKLQNFKNVGLFKCNGLDLSELSDCSFDLVYSVWVFQHVSRKVFLEYLKEINRILKPNGILIFQIFERLKVKGLIPRYWLRNLRHLHFYFWQSPPNKDTWTARAYSRNELKEILGETDFGAINFENPTLTEGDLWVTAYKKCLAAET